MIDVCCWFVTCILTRHAKTAPYIKLNYKITINRAGTKVVNVIGIYYYRWISGRWHSTWFKYKCHPIIEIIAQVGIKGQIKIVVEVKSSCRKNPPCIRTLGYPV